AAGEAVPAAELAASMRKPSTEQRRPTPAQERALEGGCAGGGVRWRSRTRSNGALEPRQTGWQRGPRPAATRCQPAAEGKDRRAAFPDDAALQRHVLPDVLARRARTSHACFGRVPVGSPRFPGRNRSQSFTYQESGTGVQLDTGLLVLATRGRAGRS